MAFTMKNVFPGPTIPLYTTNEGKKSAQMKFHCTCFITFHSMRWKKSHKATGVK